MENKALEMLKEVRAELKAYWNTRIMPYNAIRRETMQRIDKVINDECKKERLKDDEIALLEEEIKFLEKENKELRERLSYRFKFIKFFQGLKPRGWN